MTHHSIMTIHHNAFEYASVTSCYWPHAFTHVNGIISEFFLFVSTIHANLSMHVSGTGGAFNPDIFHKEARAPCRKLHSQLPEPALPRKVDRRKRLQSFKRVDCSAIWFKTTAILSIRNSNMNSRMQLYWPEVNTT